MIYVHFAEEGAKSPGRAWCMQDPKSVTSADTTVVVTTIDTTEVTCPECRAHLDHLASQLGVRARPSQPCVR